MIDALRGAACFSAVMLSLAVGSSVVASDSAPALDEVKFASCKRCETSAEFREIAELQSFMQQPDRLDPDRVQVVNPLTGESRFFIVERRIDGSYLPGSLEADYPRLGEKLQKKYGGRLSRADAIEGPADEAALETWRQTYSGIRTLRDADWSHEALLGGSLDSAISLIGPEGSEATRFQKQLIEELTFRAESWFLDFRPTLDEDAWQMFRAVFLARQENGFSMGHRLSFPDGTWTMITLRFLVPHEGLADEVDVRVELDLTTTQGPELIAVPQHARHFDNFSYRGSRDVTLELAELARRYERSITVNGDGLDCALDCDEQDCELSCPDSPDH